MDGGLCLGLAEAAISILVIDGESSPQSGVSSALFNLLEIMRRAAPDGSSTGSSDASSDISSGRDGEARPCDCFDLIVGSGDGGWLAIMLGRLGMSVSQTIRAYKEIHSAVHHASRDLSVEERAEIFEQHLKELVRTHSVGDNPDEKLRASKSKTRCQTAVLAMTAQHVAAPTVFRTYKARKHRIDDCAIWMAIRACTSNPNLFPAAQIGDQCYVSASHAGQSNPIDIAVSEAKVAYPNARIHCIVSLGSGHPGPISFSKLDANTYNDVVISIAKDAERKAEQAAHQFHSSGRKIYFRFNVEQGLQHYLHEADGLYGEAKAHAAVYCGRQDIDELMDVAVAQLLSCGCAQEITLSSNTPPTSLEVPQWPPGEDDTFEVHVSSFPPTQTYVNELYPLGFGFPLWDPHPRSKPIEFGDVGVLTLDGGFDILFNATIPAAEQKVAGFKVPKDFVPLQLPSFHLDPVPDVMPDPYLISSGVKLSVKGLGSQESGPNNSPHPKQQNFKLTFQVSQGATVVFNDPPIRIAVPPNLVIESYIRQHCKSWYAFCRDQKKGLGRALADYDLILITGLHQNAQWAVGAWSNNGAQSRLSYSGIATIKDGGPSALQGAWVPKFGSGTKQGPSTARAALARRERFRSLGQFDSTDQTLFIEGYKLGMRPRQFPSPIQPSIPFDEPHWLATAKKVFRLRIPSVIRAGAEPQDLPPPPPPDPDAAAHLIEDKATVDDEGDFRILNVHPKPKHPLDQCLDILFESSLDTEVYVVHDRTLLAAIREGCPLPSVPIEDILRAEVREESNLDQHTTTSQQPAESRSLGQPDELLSPIPSSSLSALPDVPVSAPFAGRSDRRLRRVANISTFTPIKAQESPPPDTSLKFSARKRYVPRRRENDSSLVKDKPPLPSIAPSFKSSHSRFNVTPPTPATKTPVVVQPSMTKATFEDVIVQRKNDDVQYGSKGGATDEEAISKTLVIREAGKGFMQLRLGNCIAQGRFASAYRAMSLETGQTVIVKQVPLTQLTEENISNLMMEVEVVKKLRHPCLIKYEGIMRDENHLNLVLEYAENGSLKQTLRAFGSLNERLTASYVVKILSALQYLHQINVLHGNLKASNILTKKNGNIKLADFGLSLNRIALEGDMRRNSSEGVGSPNWTAPELFELKDVSTKSDIWSLGCTIVELMTGKPPYADIVNPMSVAFRVVEDKYPPLPENCSTVLVDFLLQCFDKDPAMRPSADVLYAHSWLVTGESIAGHSPSTRLPSRVNNYPSVINPFLRRDTIEGNEAAFDDASSIPPLPVFDVSPLASDKSARTSAATSAARSSSRSAPDDSLSAPPPRKHSLVRTTFSKPMTCRVCKLNVKKEAFICPECSLIVHSKCATRAPPTCDGQAQLLRFAREHDEGKAKLARGYQNHLVRRSSVTPDSLKDIQSSSLEQNIDTGNRPSKSSFRSSSTSSLPSANPFSLHEQAYPKPANTGIQLTKNSRENKETRSNGDCVVQ